jgi:hypothetical protein
VARQLWTDDMISFLGDAYKRHSIEDAARLLNEKFGTDRTREAVRSATRRYRLRCGRRKGQLKTGQSRLFTKQMIEFMTVNYPVLSRRDLCQALNESFGTSFTFDQVRSYLKNNGIKSGRDGRFPLGHIPFCAGTKGTGLMKANRTSFKKGDVPRNTQPIGTIIVENKDGYQIIKVAEGDWQFLHRVVWEREHGPVPDGYVVSLLDGDKMNCTLDNLELISRGELAQRNKARLQDVPAELKPLVNTLVRLRIAKASAKRQLVSGKERAA